MPNVDFLEEIRKADDSQGFFLRDLQSGDLIRVNTMNSVYHLVILDPEQGRVAIRGSQDFFSTPERVRINGSTFGGSALKAGWVGTDMFLEIDRDNGTRVRTSVIREVAKEEDPGTATEITRRAVSLVS